VTPDPAFRTLAEARLAFALAGEVNDGFLSQIAAFRLALQALPKPFKNARILAFLGAEPGQDTVPAPWRRRLGDVDIRIIVHDGQEGYVPQARARFALDEPGIDYVFLCDADTLPVGPLDAALQALIDGAPVTGVIAHGPPPHFRNSHWNVLANELTGTPLTFPHRYTIWEAPNPELDAASRAPFYLNHGLIGFQAAALCAFYPAFLTLRKAVAERVEHPNFAGQMGLTLAVHQLGWQGAALPMRYNFPSDDRALARHPDEATDLRLLHFLREGRFTRATLFADASAFEAFMATRPDGADALFYDALMRLTGGDYPF